MNLIVMPSVTENATRRHKTVNRFLCLFAAGLLICASPGCARFFHCCPPTNSLIKQSEAESISGVKLKLAYEILDAKRSSCSYVNGGTDLSWVSLDLHQFEDGGGPSNEAAHRAVHAKYGENLENITGIGDSAFIAQNGSGFSLYARKANLGIQLWAKSVLPPSEAREKFLAVARLVVARLE